MRAVVAKGPFKKMFLLEMLSSLRAVNGSPGLHGRWRGRGGDVDGHPTWRKAGTVDAGEERPCLLAGEEFGPSAGAIGQD